MALIVETGAIVANANSYSSLAQIRQYATDRGITLSADDDAVSALGIKAMDYIEGFADEYKGAMVDAETQTLSWPRTGATVNGVLLGDTFIPAQLRYAQGAAVLELHKGNDLQPFDNGIQVKSKSLGPLSLEYFSARGRDVIVPVIDSLLAPLLDRTAALTSRRV